MSKGIPRIIIQFRACTIVYESDWTIRLEGEVYPRQLKAASEMIEIYKRCSKENAKPELIYE